MEVCDCLNLYCSWTGQSINWGKLSVHFSSNTSMSDKRRICDMLKMTECGHTRNYLGNPLCKFRDKSEAFQPLVDRLAIKLAGWKSKLLSAVGRMVLVKTVAMAIPSYVMQSTLLPVKTCDRMDALI